MSFLYIWSIFKLIVCKKYYGTLSVPYLVMNIIFILIILFLIFYKINKRSLEKTYMFIVIPVGLAFMILQPMHHKPDEPHHIYRTYDIVVNHNLMPNKDEKNISRIEYPIEAAQLHGNAVNNLKLVDDNMNKYIDFDKSRIGHLSNINDKDAVILISNEREKPFMNLNRIINGYDKFVKIKPTDTVFFMEPINDYNEKLAIKVIDDISKAGASVVTMSKKDNLLHHASSEDIMLMLDLMNPKYYMPVIGEYRHMVANANAASHIGMKKENILLKQNGDVVTFINGNLKETREKVKTDDILIDGKNSFCVPRQHMPQPDG